MAKILASSQITITDLNDAVSLRSHIGCSHAKVQMMSNNKSYIPDYTIDPVILTGYMNKIGDNTDLIKQPGLVVKRVDWYVKIAPGKEFVKITPTMTEYELIGTTPFFSGLKIKANILNASHPGVTIKMEADFQERWMEDIHTQISEIDIELTVQGEDGKDAYTAVLTNSSHTIICNPNGLADDGEIGITGRAYCDAIAYKGTRLLTAVTGTPAAGQYSITLADENCSSVKKDADTFYINTLTSPNAMIEESTGVKEELVIKNGNNGGKVKVSFNLEGTTTIVQEMTFSKVYNGTNGVNGSDGADGESAKYISLAFKEGGNVFKYEKNQTNPTFTRVVLKANKFNIPTGATHKWYYYSNSGWTLINDQTTEELIINHNDSYFTASNSISFRCTVNNLYSDDTTISKLIDGNDSVLVQLSNESHVIGCYNGGGFKPGEADRAFTEIKAYKGIAPLTLVTGTPTTGQYKISIVANSAVTHTLTNNVLKVTNMTADSAALIIDVNCEGTVYKKTFSLSKAKDGREGIDGYVATLTNEFHALPANSSGNVTSYNGASSSIELYKGDTLLTEGVTYSATPSTGISGSLAGNTYTVTALSTDISSVNLTATYNGKSYSKVFTLTKNKQGANGSDSTSYWIIPSTTSINKDKNGVLNPTSIVYSAKSQTGVQALTDFAGRFKIYTSTNKGQTWTLSYTSGANESSKTFSIPNNATAIKGELYLTNGTTLVDTQTIIVTTDGQDGENGKDAAYVIVAGENVFKYGPNFIGAPTPSSITLTRSLFNTTGGKWQYHDNTSWVDFSPSETGATLNVTPTLGHFATSSNKIMRVRYAVNETIYDETTILKVADGAAGSDAFTVVLDNESHTVAANTSGALLPGEKEKAITKVLVYKGTDVVTNFTLIKASDEGIVTAIDTTNKTIALSSMPDGTMSGKSIVKIGVEGQEIQKVFSVTKSKQAADGTPAKLVTLNASSQTFITDKEGATTPNESITLTASLQGLTGTVAWTKSIDGGATFIPVTETVAGNTLTVTKANIAQGKTVTYKASSTTYYDTVSISHVADGLNAYTVVMTNESHTLPASNNGTVSTTELDKTETQIIVYQGSNTISNFTLATESLTGCTVSTNTSNKTIKLTAMSSDTASYVAVITVGGQILKKKFTATKSKAAVDGTPAKVVTVSGEQVFKYPAGASTPSNVSIELSRTLQGVSGGKWQHYNGTAWTDFNPAQTGETISIAHNMANTLFATAANMSMRIKYIAGDNTTFDEITISKVKDGINGSAGTDAYTVILSNPSHTVKADSNGTVSSSDLNTAQTDIIVYKGASTVIPTVNNMVCVPSSATFNLTNATSTTPAKLTMTAFPSNVDSATCTVNVIVGGQTLKQTFSVTKAKQGVQGNAAKAVFVSGPQIFKYTTTNGVQSVSPTSITLSAIEKNFTGSARKWYANDTVISGQTGTNLVINPNSAEANKYFMNSDSVTFKYESDTLTDEITVVKMYDGSDTYSVFLSNESHSIACDKNGYANSTELAKAITKVKVFRGTTELGATNTSAINKFKISTPLTMADGSGTCVYVTKESTDVGDDGANVGIKLTAANKDSGSVPITIDIENGKVSATKVFTFSKAKVGADGSKAVAIQITGANTIIYDKNGAYDPSQGIVLTIQKKNTTGAITWKNGSTTLGTGDTYTVPTSAFNNIKNYTVKAELTGDASVYDTHTITKVTDGVDSITTFLHCPNGNVIRNNDVDRLTVEASIFNGTTNVSSSANAKYVWEKKVGTQWVSIKGTTASPVLGSAKGNTIEVMQDQIPSMLVVRCTMTYGGITQADTVVLEDQNDPVQSRIFSTAGNTFKNGVGNSYLVAKTNRNGQEMDVVRLVDAVPSEAGVQGEIIYVKSLKKYYKYDNKAWVVIDTPECNNNSTYTYQWSKSDADGNLIEGWVRTGKVIYITSEEIDQKAIYSVDVLG